MYLSFLISIKRQNNFIDSLWRNLLVFDISQTFWFQKTFFFCKKFDSRGSQIDQFIILLNIQQNLTFQKTKIVSLDFNKPTSIQFLKTQKPSLFDLKMIQSISGSQISNSQYYNFSLREFQKMEILNLKKCGRTIPSFLKKTYEMLQESNNDSIVKWIPSGAGFMIINELQFAKTILPKYFKHNKYSSFVRQLNMYNFHKIRSSANENCFIHQKFIRNDLKSIQSIKRKTQRKKKKIENDDASCEKQGSQFSELQDCKIKSNIKSKKTVVYNKNPKSVTKQNNEKYCFENQKIVDRPVSICLKNTPLNSKVFIQKECPITGLELQDYDDNISIQNGIQSVERSHLRIPTKLLLLNSGSVIFPLNTGMISIYSMSSLLK